MKDIEEVQCAQRSQAWFDARLGKLTGSRAADATTKLKNGNWGTARHKYMVELVAERLIGVAGDADQFITREMQRGIDFESLAFAEYEAQTGRIARPCGFLQSLSLRTGTSPDGIVADLEGVLEIKCPKSVTHLGYLTEGILPDEYIPQMRHHLWISGAEYCDFVSFDDRFPEGMKLFVRRLYAKDAKLDVYDHAARAFLAEVDEYERTVRLNAVAIATTAAA